MKHFYYTKTHDLIQSLGALDELRKELTLIPLSPKQELQFKWEGILNTIYYSIKLNGRTVNRRTIAELLSPTNKKELTEEENLVIGLKKGLDYVFYNWNLNNQLVTEQTVQELFRIIFNEDIQVDSLELKTALKYIQVTSEHPVIQAVVAHIIFFDLFPTLTQYKLFSNVIFLLFLYKYGYTFRGFNAIEKEFIEGKVNYKEVMYECIKQENITACIEYIVRTLSANITTVISEIKEKLQSQKPDLFFELTDRQKAILAMLDNPQVTITNKKVQQMFNVSQITASRDLSQLTSVGLLFSIGKGRSTYYTKV